MSNTQGGKRTLPIVWAPTHHRGLASTAANAGTGSLNSKPRIAHAAAHDCRRLQRCRLRADWYAVVQNFRQAATPPCIVVGTVKH